MKKTALFLILICNFTAFAALPRTVVNDSNSFAGNYIGGSFKIINDTDADLQIHTGAGFIELNKGASTSVTCESGREIRKANKGKKGEVIFTVDDSMCGKVVKLSKYL